MAERLGPALSEAVATLGIELPKPCWAALTAARLENERRAAAQAEVLLELVPRLEASGIQPVVFKGLSLERHYPAKGVREASDLDLLVPPGRMDEASAVVRGRGYEAWGGGGRLASSYAVSFTREAASGSAIIDLHPAWHEVRLSEDGSQVQVGTHAEPVDQTALCGVSVGVLPSGVELHLTAAHAVLHTFRTLSVYLDLAVLLAGSQGAALERAVSLAREMGRDRHLKHALSLSADLFGVDVGERPRRWRAPLALRAGYLGRRRRFLPSSLLMELVLLRGVRRKLDFARWVMGHTGGGEAQPAAGSGRRTLRTVRGLHWLKGTVLTYRQHG
jgi:hypothetical protein